MDTMQEPLTTSPPIARRRGRSWLWLGVGLFLLGLVLNFVQLLWMKLLVVPWYMPILATVGALSALVSIRKRPTWTRGIALVILAVLTAGEWYFLLSISRLPEYTGPVQVERPIPEFATTLADGRPFTEKDVQQGAPTVLVFYRGRW
jgi:hypothetical protein